MPIDASVTVSEVTRRSIFDTLASQKFAWWGRLYQTEFLSRMFDLNSLPSEDRRYETAAEDIYQHCVYNDDWDIDWVFHDDRFNLLFCPDTVFFTFLTQMAHPVVHADPQEVAWLIGICNKYLIHDGWVVAEQAKISGRPIFEVKRIDVASSGGSPMTEPRRPDTGAGITISQQSIVALREYLSSWTLRQIRNAFDSAGIMPSESFEPEQRIRGERIRLVMKYLHSVDITRKDDVEKLVTVFEYVLDQLAAIIDANAGTSEGDGAQRVTTKLLGLLQRDGFEYKHGRVILASKQSPAVSNAISDTTLTANPAKHTADSSRHHPTAFVSYSWDSTQHRQWVREFAKLLRSHGVDVKLDHWDVSLGDPLPHFMETAIRTNDFVLIILTPNYRERSDDRMGGVGYEGNVITAEIFAGKDHRKFIPILREGSWSTASPSWLAGKLGVDLRNNPYSEEQFNELLVTVHGMQEKAPPLGPPPSKGIVGKAGGEFAPLLIPQMTINDDLSVEVLSLVYEDVHTFNSPFPIITSSPRRFRAELGLTNHLGHAVYIKKISLRLGGHIYEREDGANVIRIEAREYKEIDESFPVNVPGAAQSGDFDLEITPAVGSRTKVTGSAPVERP